MNDIKTQTVQEMAVAARDAARVLAGLDTETKNRALLSMAQALESGASAVLEANQKDLEFSKQENIPGPLIARLALDEHKVAGMAKGIRSVADLPDPVGKIQGTMEMDQGLIVRRVSCPLGVIGAIFESRPDAVPQIASLCLKSGNAVILKGGREAQRSNKMIVRLLRDALSQVSGVPADAVQLIETRAEVLEMLKQEKHIDLVVPRGSNEFVRYVQDNTKIPVLGHSEGICHVYIDDEADPAKALGIGLDAKLQYPAACNTMETLLVHERIAPQVLPQIAQGLREKGVDLVGDRHSCSLVTDMSKASEEEWDTEYNDLKLAVRIVSDYEEAMDHINAHGSGHTDTIVTENRERAERFMNEVDSSSVIWNASTRFADGFRFGLGAEIGISTNKTHARGPVGLEGLVIYKYKVFGSGQTVTDYSGKDGKEFTHKPLPNDTPL